MIFGKSILAKPANKAKAIRAITAVTSLKKSKLFNLLFIPKFTSVNRKIID
jgi:hypothetical protein